MANAMVLERTGVGFPGVTFPTPTTPTVGAPTSFPTGFNWTVVPRCTFKFEKCTGGYKVWCYFEDKLASSMVQNLCSMLAGGLCSFCCYWNGAPVYFCHYTFATCKYEFTDSGCCFTFTSGDPQWAKIIQSCCECCHECYETGCTCCFFMNSTPVCCGVYGDAGKPAKAKG